jgi:hypothetical protein
MSVFLSENYRTITFELIVTKNLKMVNLSEREADTSNPSSMEVINVYSALYGFPHTSLLYAGTQGQYHINITTYSRITNHYSLRRNVL